MDRLIRFSTAIVVLGVACVAAYVSYWHAYEVVRAHGETGTTARLVPATVDGLVYASSMVMLYAARHRLAVPILARVLLAVGIIATLAANIAHGWSYGPVGAVVGAWPAVSLVGCYELLMWLVRTASASGTAREPVADRSAEPQARAAAQSLVSNSGPADTFGRLDGFRENGSGSPWPYRSADGSPLTDGGNGRRSDELEGESRSAEETVADHSAPSGMVHRWDGAEDDINSAAVAAYRASVDAGEPLSERKLAMMFGKTSRRWARNRMTEADQALTVESST